MLSDLTVDNNVSPDIYFVVVEILSVKIKFLQHMVWHDPVLGHEAVSEGGRGVMYGGDVQRSTLFNVALIQL